MTVRVPVLITCLAVLLTAPALSACGGGEEAASATGPEPDVAIARLGPSVEAASAEFLARPGTALARALAEFLGPATVTAVQPGTTVCRPASQVPSIDDPRRYPFACVIEATADDGSGLEVEIVLGFVGTGLEGRCWAAANERVLVTGTRPTLLDRREAMRPVNGIEGCA